MIDVVVLGGELQVLSVESDEQKTKLKDFVMAATR